MLCHMILLSLFECNVFNDSTLMRIILFWVDIKLDKFCNIMLGSSVLYGFFILILISCIKFG